MRDLHVMLIHIVRFVKLGIGKAVLFLWPWCTAKPCDILKGNILSGQKRGSTLSQIYWWNAKNSFHAGHQLHSTYGYGTNRPFRGLRTSAMQRWLVVNYRYFRVVSVQGPGSLERRFHSSSVLH